MKSSKMNRNLCIWALAAMALLSPQARADEMAQPQPTPASPETKAAGDARDKEIEPVVEEGEVEKVSESPVKVRVGMPLWMTSVSGDVGARGLTASMGTIDFQDIFGHLDYVIPGSVGVEYGKWEFLAEGQFTKLSDSLSPKGPFFTGGKVEMEQAFVDINIGYKVVETEQFTLSPFVGTRIEYVDLDMRLNTVIPNVTVDRSGDQAWADPILGLGLKFRACKPVSLIAKADVGGFGAASHLTYQALAGVEVQITKGFYGSLVYRYLNTDYSSDGFTYNVAYGGPQITLGYKF